MKMTKITRAGLRPAPTADGRPATSRPVRRYLAGVLLLALLLAGGGLAVYAQTGGSYDLTWWTVDGGGKTGLSGGSYTLFSTAGQPDAQEAISGGSYTLLGGFWPSGIPTSGKLYLPLILKAPLPDLTATTFTIDPANPQAGQAVLVTVIVTNIGSATANEFWVDFYINPSALPAVNKRWNDLCSLSPCYGLAWYVSQKLAPGESVTLTSNNYAPDYSRWSGYFISGTTDLYVYVDSWNPTVSTGGVLEGNEDNNSDHIGGLTVTGLAPAAAEPPSQIPPRPARLK